MVATTATLCQTAPPGRYYRDSTQGHLVAPETMKPMRLVCLLEDQGGTDET